MTLMAVGGQQILIYSLSTPTHRVELMRLGLQMKEEFYLKIPVTVKFSELLQYMTYDKRLIHHIQSWKMECTDTLQMQSTLSPQLVPR